MVLQPWHFDDRHNGSPTKNHRKLHIPPTHPMLNPSISKFFSKATVKEAAEQQRLTRLSALDKELTDEDAEGEVNKEYATAGK